MPEVPNLFVGSGSDIAGGVERSEMFRTFNMGVGMVAILAERDADDVVASISSAGARAWRLGTVAAGSGRVILI